MLLRFIIALLLGSILARSSYAQQSVSSAVACVAPPKSTNSNSSQCNLDFISRQVISDVVVSGASLNDAFGGGAATTCGVAGQVYRPPAIGRLTSIMRVSRDGSTLLFALPDETWPIANAPDETGLNVLAHHFSRTATDSFEMYRFDSHARLLTQHSLAVDLRPSTMGITNSGKTILLGHPLGDQEGTKYRGAVLDADDGLVKQFELPSHAGSGEWKVFNRTASGDGGVYVILYSDTAPRNAIARISDDGHIDIKLLAVPEDSDKHRHNEWLFGPGVAVEVYHYLVRVGTLPRAFDGFDEYDLNTGERVAIKGLFPVGFAFGCYTGSEVSMLAHSAHVDPARHLSPETIRLVTAKLQ